MYEYPTYTTKYLKIWLFFYKVYSIKLKQVQNVDTYQVDIIGKPFK